MTTFNEFIVADAALLAKLLLGKLRGFSSAQFVELGCTLLDGQIAAQEIAFPSESGLTRRLYRVRSQWRNRG